MENEPKILPRDKLLRDTFTPAESLLCVHILVTTLITFWLADPRSFWSLGILLIAGGGAPFILKTHERTHPFFIDLLWPKFWIFSAPAWLLALQFMLGLLQDPLASIEIDGAQFLTIHTIQPWLPVSAATPNTWITVLGFGAMYLITLNLFIVPKSRAFFEKTLPWLCLSAVIVCIFGYMQEALGLQKPLFTKGTGNSDFFAFFPYDGHWAAFATIWCAACMAMALASTRYEDSPDFIHSIGPWYLAGAGVLGCSGYLIEARWPSIILLITFSLLLFIFCVHFLKQSKDQNRTLIAVTSGILACALLASGIFHIFQNPDLNNIQAALRSAAIEMFKDSPLFGWGMDSFAQVAPFYLDDTLMGERYYRAGSDALQMLAEFGLVGTIIPILTILALLIRYLKKKATIELTNHLLIGCLALLILALCDTPFMSPAVFISFFALFFSALRWADLSRTKVDEVDAIKRPNLVVPESERRVPFFTGEYQDKEV